MKRFSLSVLLFSCIQTLVAQVPTISSFSPVSGYIGSTVVISGTNFSPTVANNIVFFGPVKASVKSASSTALAVVVPDGAMYQPITVTVNKLTAYSALPFLATFTGGLDVNAHTLTYDNNLATEFTYSFNFSDLDGDGKPDIVSNNSVFGVSSYQDSIDPIYAYRNASTVGNIIFGKPLMVANSRSETFTATGDLDGDGKPDIVFVSSTSNWDSFSIAKNTSTSGSISFAKPISFANAYPGAFAIGDLNGDGKPDIVVANTAYSNFLSVYQNTTTAVGNITLGQPQFLATNEYPFSILINDLDGDGKPDIIMTDGTDSLVVFKNTSAGGVISFGSKKSYSIDSGLQLGGAIVQPSMTLGDIDGDGKVDIICLTAYSATGYNVGILRNTSNPGTISFAPQVDFPTSCDQSSVTVNDIDGDGKPDIILKNCYDIAVLKNTSTSGNIALLPEIDYSSSNGAGYGTIASADLDGDGKPDIAASDNGFSMYLNTPYLCTPPGTTNTLMPAPLGIQWLHTYGGAGDDEASCIAAITDTTFIAAGALHLNDDSLDDNVFDSADASIAKYSTNGNKLWQKVLGGNKEDIIYSVVKAANGSCIAVGTSSSNTGAFSGNHGGDDLWVIKLDSLGNIVWQKLLGGSGNDANSSDYAPVIRMTPDNNYIILSNTMSPEIANTVPVDTVNGNSWLVKINESGTVIWQKVYPDTIAFYDLQVTPDRCFMLPGNANNDSSYDNSIVAKLDSVGNIVFSKVLNTTDVFENITANADSSYTLTGYTEASGDTCTGEHGSLGNYELPVMRIDKQGNVLWEKYFGGSNDDAVTGLTNSIISTNDGGNLITGYTYSNDGNVTGSHDTTGSSNDDGWVIKIDANGNLQWQRPVGGTGEDYLDGAIQLSNGNYIVTGSSTTLNNGDIYGIAGSYDGIVFEIGPGISFCPSSDTSITCNVSGTSYQWQVNSGSGYINISNNTNYTGVATQVLHIAKPSTSWYGYTYRCVVNGTTYSEVTNLKFTEQWIGAVSNAWENAANWSCSILPDTNTDVIVKSGNIVLSSNQSVRSLTLYNGATITIKTGNKLTLTGK